MISEAQARDFFSNVNKESRHTYNGTQCWEWTGLTDGGKLYPPGHGVLSYNGKRIEAYRFLWIQFLGRNAPKRMQLHHRCHNKLCVNPEHLELLTPKEHRGRHPRGRRPRPVETVTILEPQDFFELGMFDHLYDGQA
jgi:hypothetical protein